jgi:hypothetical protein
MIGPRATTNVIVLTDLFFNGYLVPGARGYSCTWWAYGLNTLQNNVVPDKDASGRRRKLVVIAPFTEHF